MTHVLRGAPGAADGDGHRSWRRQAGVTGDSGPALQIAVAPAPAPADDGGGAGAGGGGGDGGTGQPALTPRRTPPSPWSPELTVDQPQASVVGRGATAVLAAKTKGDAEAGTVAAADLRQRAGDGRRVAIAAKQGQARALRRGRWCAASAGQRASDAVRRSAGASARRRCPAGLRTSRRSPRSTARATAPAPRTVEPSRSSGSEAAMTRLHLHRSARPPPASCCGGGAGRRPSPLGAPGSLVDRPPRASATLPVRRRQRRVGRAQPRVWPADRPLGRVSASGSDVVLDGDEDSADERLPARPLGTGRWRR